MKIITNGLCYMLCSSDSRGFTMFERFINSGPMTALYVGAVHTGSVDSEEFGRAWRAYQCQ